MGEPHASETTVPVITGLGKLGKEYSHFLLLLLFSIKLLLVPLRVLVFLSLYLSLLLSRSLFVVCHAVKLRTWLQAIQHSSPAPGRYSKHTQPSFEAREWNSTPSSSNSSSGSRRSRSSRRKARLSTHKALIPCFGETWVVELLALCWDILNITGHIIVLLSWGPSERP